MKLCIKTTSDKAFIPDELAGLCREFRGTTAVCFYLTDTGKMILPKNRLSLCVDADSSQHIKRLYDVSQIGLIQ